MAAGDFLIRAFHCISTHYSPLHQLRRLSTGVNLNPSPAANSILHFLRGRGLGDDACAGFPPRLLDSKVSKDLPAKFDLLLTRGFSVKEAAKVLGYNDLLDNISLITLRRRLDTLRTIIADDADLPRIINRARWTFYGERHVERMVQNVSKLRGWGVSDAKIRFFLVNQPRFLQLKPQCVDAAADRAEAEFGFRRDSKMFVTAVNVLWRISESTRQSKFGVFESFGWETSDIMALFKLYPTIITLAEATLVKKLDFLMNQLGYDPSCIMRYPAMLGYSLEKRVRPRYEVVKALKSKNLLPKGSSLKPWSMVEEEFMEKYVIKFMKKEPAICNAYIKTVASPKQQPSGFVEQSLSLSNSTA